MAMVSNNINEMSISNAFSALEEKINSFMDDFARVKLIGKEKSIKVVFATPFFASSLRNESYEGGNLKEGYIHELYACIPEGEEKVFLSVGHTDNYIDIEENTEVEYTPFSDLLIDDKAMVATELEDESYFIVGEDFENHSYQVLEDSGYVYNVGDYITTTLLARDFLEGCNEVEDSDYIAHIYSLLYNNKGEELVNNICELWDGLKLKKIF